MSGGHLVDVNFWAAFIIDIVIVVYAIVLSKRMGGQGLLNRSTLYAGASALVFGIHHLLELFLEGHAHGITISESVEAVAAILLLLAVYELYKLVGGKKNAK